MRHRKLNWIALCFLSFVFAPAGLLLAQQAETDRSLAEQPNPKAHYLVDYLTARDNLGRPTATYYGVKDWRLATTTYGNQLGVEIAELEGALRAQLDIEDGNGVLVTGVSPDSVAAKALLVQHDVILKIDEQATSGTKQFNDLMGTLQGRTAQFHILRRGKPVAVSVALPKSPVYALATDVANANALSEAITVQLGSLRHYRIGVTLAEADEVLRSQLRLAAGEGLVVTDVMADSPAAKAGIQRHDVLTKLDGKRLTAIEAVNAQIQEIKDRSVPLALYRAGNEVLLSVTPKLADESLSRQVLLESLVELDGTFRVHDRQTSAPLLWRRLNLNVAAPDSSPPATAAAQLGELRKQLADLQKAMETLEATLKTEPESKPLPPAEPK